MTGWGGEGRGGVRFGFAQGGEVPRLRRPMRSENERERNNRPAALGMTNFCVGTLRSPFVQRASERKDRASPVPAKERGKRDDKLFWGSTMLRRPFYGVPTLTAVAWNGFGSIFWSGGPKIALSCPSST